MHGIISLTMRKTKVIPTTFQIVFITLLICFISIGVIIYTNWDSSRIDKPRVYRYNPQPEGTIDNPETISMIDNKLKFNIVDELMKNEYGISYNDLTSSKNVNRKSPGYGFCDYKVLGTIDSKSYIVAYLKYGCGYYTQNNSVLTLHTGRYQPMVVFIDLQGENIFYIDQPIGKSYNYDIEHLFPGYIRQREMEYEKNGLRMEIFKNKELQSTAEQYFDSR